MDWCFDGSVPGARAVVEAEVGAHLRRRAAAPGTVGWADALVSTALADLETQRPGARHRVSLDWAESVARLRLVTLPWGSGPLPGHPAAPGVTLGHEAWAELEALTSEADGVTIDLGVARVHEPDIDPDPGDRTMPEERGACLGAIAALITAGAGGDHSPEELAALAGSVAGRTAESSYRSRRAATGRLDAGQVAEAFVEAQQRLGGDFYVVESTPERAVLGNRACPFGAAVRDAPPLCRFTSAMIGSIAARQAREAAVTLDERLALGDRQCRVALKLGSGPPSVGSHRYTDPPAGLPQRSATGAVHGHHIGLTLRLPRDRASVPLIRHLAHHALEEAGVTADIIADIDLVVSEASANVLDHAGPGDAYDVTVTVAPSTCEVRVIDVGHGFDHESLTTGPPDARLDAERGRGLGLMRALMDEVRIDSVPERGTIVHLVKQLQFDESSLARRLLAAGDPESG